MKLKKLAILLIVFAVGMDSSMAASASDLDEGLDLARKLNGAFVHAIDQVVPSVVVIAVRSSVGAFEGELEESPIFKALPDEEKERFRKQMEDRQDILKWRGQFEERPFTGQGSGVILREDGFILTNRHVIEGAETVRVTLHDGTELDAVIQGEDQQSDLAVLKVEATGLPAARFAKTGDVKVGQFAFAIGAPFSLDYSATFGHVSAKGRTQVVPDYLGGGTMDQDFIQTDAGINPGNSGGPLINIEGEVIGINTLIRGMNTGIGFAITSDLVLEVSERLIKEGRYARGYLGVRIQTLRDSVDRAFIKGVEEGVIVAAIPASGPAASSSLRPMDVIISVNEDAVTTSAELKAAIRVKRAGETIRLAVVRNGESEMIDVVLGEFPEGMIQTGARLSSEKPVVPKSVSAFGMTIDESGNSRSSGVTVTKVDEQSISAFKRIVPGDVVTGINHEPVEGIEDFRRLTDAADLKKGVIVNLTSSAGRRFVILREIGE